MSEATETSNLRRKLTNKGFYVIKLADKSTLGLPDSLIIKDSKVLFVENKLFERSKMPTEFKEFSKIPIDNQLMTMVELQKKGAYVLYNFMYKIPESQIMIAVIRPLALLNSVSNKLPLVLPQMYSFDQWISRFENRLLFL